MIKIKVAWQWYRVGDVIQPPAMLRNWLLQQGFAEVIAEAAPLKHKKKRTK